MAFVTTTADASASDADATIVGQVSWVDGITPVCDPIPEPGGGGAGGEGGGSGEAGQGGAN